MSAPKQYFVYFLQSGRKSYIGFTVNVGRRLRQHRGELVGGAKATRQWPDRRNLELVAFISGFPTKKSALSYEWHAKRRCPPVYTFRPICETHWRLPGFFYPATTPKFRNIKPLLTVTLMKHHEVIPVLDSHFDLTRVVSV